MAEEEKEKAQKEGIIGLVWDTLQIAAGTVLVVKGVGTGFDVVLIAGGVNGFINHASMATTGKSFNIVGNLTNEVGKCYNKSIGKSLGKTGAYGFVNGFISGTGEIVSGMAQFSVYDTGKAVILC
ncbi:hypothetical protein [Clostridium felsineum]|uniref:hypothetical protein n=1 Tax=Clostridium felsineum TaxID=36839 RepID=UPI00214D359D|nr:hypothetical protein [Clostridium felsineum]